MAGPSPLLREICPPVVASSGGVGGNDGYLTAQQYEEIIAAISGGGLPDQSGNSGKFLSTNGTNTSWLWATTGVGYYDIRAYGAVIDGVTDDSAAWLAALAAACANNRGGVVIHPGGRSLISSAVTAALSGGGFLCVRGNAGNSIIIVDLDDVTDLFSIDATATNTTHVRFENIIFRGNVPDAVPEDTNCRKAIKISSSPLCMASVELCSFYGVVGEQSIVECIGGNAVISRLQFVGCASPKHILTQCRNASISKIVHIDLGNFDGGLWNGSSYPLCSLIYCKGQAPAANETIPASYAEISDIAHDEVINTTVTIDGDASTFGRARICGIRAQLATLASATLVQTYKVARVEIEDCYANTLGNSSSFLVDAYYTTILIARRLVGETGHVSASKFQFDNNCTYALIEDCNYSTITPGATCLVRVQGAGSLQLPVYTDGTRPAANTVTAGTMIFNSSDNFPNVSDGANWRDMSGGIT